jgi:hypothetical protein
MKMTPALSASVSVSIVMIKNEDTIFVFKHYVATFKNFCSVLYYVYCIGLLMDLHMNL